MNLVRKAYVMVQQAREENGISAPTIDGRGRGNAAGDLANLFDVEGGCY